MVSRNADVAEHEAGAIESALVTGANGETGGGGGDRKSTVSRHSWKGR